MRLLPRVRREGLLAPEQMPLRRQDLIVQEVGDDVLLVDPKTGEAHHLNPRG